MEIRVETTKESYLKYIKSYASRYIIRILIISFIMASIVTLYASYNHTDFHDCITLLFSFFIIYTLLMGGILWFRYYKQLKKLDKKTYIQIYTLREDGINIVAEKGDIFYRWGNIKRVKKDKDYILIYITGRLVYGIPNAYFTTVEDENKFLNTAVNGIAQSKDKK